MPRVRRVPLIYGRKRIIFKNGEPKIVQSVFCGECNSITQSVTIQIGKAKADRENIPRTIIIGRACPNSDKHSDGKKYIWPAEGWIIPRI